MIVVVMDISIVNTALPSIQTDLGTSVTGLQWTVDAYALVLANFLLLAGSTADRPGRRCARRGTRGVIAASVTCSYPVVPGVPFEQDGCRCQGRGTVRSTASAPGAAGDPSVVTVVSSPREQVRSRPK
jgi:MFS family permease